MLQSVTVLGRLAELDGEFNAGPMIVGLSTERRLERSVLSPTITGPALNSPFSSAKRPNTVTLWSICWLFCALTKTFAMARFVRSI